LLACNEEFTSLVEYPLHQLQNNFQWSQINRNANNLYTSNDIIELVNESETRLKYFTEQILQGKFTHSQHNIAFISGTGRLKYCRLTLLSHSRDEIIWLAHEIEATDRIFMPETEVNSESDGVLPPAENELQEVKRRKTESAKPWADSLTKFTLKKSRKNIANKVNPGKK